ncbi:MAG: N-acetylneuraminate synthase [Ignavibacteriaceae bacterium]
MRNKIIIIAEAGVNHNGDLNLAKKMIKEAKSCGADIVKFQTAVPEEVMTAKAPKAGYQLETTDAKQTQLDMAKKIHLPLDAFFELKNLCNELKIEFLTTAFDPVSLEFIEKLNMNYYKIPSGEITNYPYLKTVGKKNKKIFLSTGMADLGEIEDALDILITSGTTHENIYVLHCNTEYPTPFEDVNLNAMLTIREALKVKIGYSDHTSGIIIPIAAAAMGAEVIEKHFTLDKNMAGPDHKASLEPQELKQMIISIRNIEEAMGNGIKKPSKSEIKNKDVVRKSIVASVDIAKGEIFSENNLTTKRPGSGISAMQWNFVIGKIAKKNFSKDDLIEL